MPPGLSLNDLNTMFRADRGSQSMLASIDKGAPRPGTSLETIHRPRQVTEESPQDDIFDEAQRALSSQLFNSVSESQLTIEQQQKMM